MRKNIIKVLVLAVAIVTSTVVNVPVVENVQEVQAASVGTVTSLKAKRTDKTELTLTWGSIYGADGYEVYMRAGTGAFKKYKTTKLNALNISKLKENTQYTFKVRAYNKEGKKTTYGSFSKKESVKLTKTVYMTDMFEPAGDHIFVDLYENKAFTLCDNVYAKGFCTYTTNASGIIYNINGDFGKLEFVWGTFDASNIGNLNVYGDDRLLYSGTSDAGQDPQTVSLDVDGVTKLTFSFTRTTNCEIIEAYTGVGNIRLTYN